jgi:hypothetical protein
LAKFVSADEVTAFVDPHVKNIDIGGGKEQVRYKTG